MGTMINSEWTPHWKTKQALERKGYSNQQYIDVGNEFLKRYQGQELDDPGRVFTAMFDKMPAHNAPKPDRTADKEQAEARKANFESKAENSAERAEEVKEGIHNPKTLKEETMRVIKARWPDTDWTESFKRMGLTK